MFSHQKTHVSYDDASGGFPTASAARIPTRWSDHSDHLTHTHSDTQEASAHGAHGRQPSPNMSSGICLGTTVPDWCSVFLEIEDVFRGGEDAVPQTPSRPSSLFVFHMKALHLLHQADAYRWHTQACSLSMTLSLFTPLSSLWREESLEG